MNRVVASHEGVLQVLHFLVDRPIYSGLVQFSSNNRFNFVNGRAREDYRMFVENSLGSRIKEGKIIKMAVFTFHDGYDDEKGKILIFYDDPIGIPAKLPEVNTQWQINWSDVEHLPFHEQIERKMAEIKRFECSGYKGYFCRKN